MQESEHEREDSLNFIYLSSWEQRNLHDADSFKNMMFDLSSHQLEKIAIKAKLCEYLFTQNFIVLALTHIKSHRSQSQKKYDDLDINESEFVHI